MAGATGSVLPTTWASGSIPAGFTFSVGASGQATANDGTVVNYVDVSVSGTATASGTFNLFFSAATGAVTATTGQTFTLSAYATCISGDITTPAMVLQVQEVSGSTFQAGTSTNIALASGAALQRVSAVRTFNQSGVTAARGRIGHPIVSGTTYNYTIRIGSPQLERLSVPTPMIATSTGAVTRLNESTDVVGLPPEFSVSRNTTATRVNSSGLIESVASGVPRIDWLGQSCPALLVEASGQNLALRSEAFDVSGTWSQNLGGTGLLPAVTANSVISPDGGQTAETIVFNRGAGNTISDRSFLEQSFTIPTTGTYTFSVYAKASAAGDVGKQIFIRLGVGSLIAITLTANWTRYSRVETSLASGSQGVQIGNRGTITADNSVSVDLWGAQVEVGSVATTYIPTTTAAVTRAADVVSASGALVSGLIGQTAGTIYCEFAYFGQPVTRSGPIYLRQGSLRGMCINFAPTDSPSGIRFSSRNNAGTTNINIVSGALQIGTFYKVAIAYDAAGTAAGGTQASGVVAYVNGVQTNIGTLQVPDAAGLTEFRMYGANSGDDNEAFNGRIRAAALYTTRLTDAQLAELTRL
jgi:hypothetical protein